MRRTRRIGATIGWLGSVAMVATLTATTGTGPATAAPSDVAGRPPTADQLRQTGTSQQRWLSVPQSRLVLNPIDFNSSQSEVEQNSGPDLPLAVGYYANDKANRLRDVVQTFRASSAGPAAPAAPSTQVGFADPFDDVDGWAASGADATAKGGRAAVTVDGAKTWGHIQRTVTLDLDQDPYLTVSVPAATGAWSLKVNDGTLADDLKLQDDTTATGTRTYDLRKATGWTGSKTVTVSIYAVGAGKSVTVDSLVAHSDPTPPPAAGEVDFADDFTTASGWTASSKGATLTSDGTEGTLALPGAGFGYRARTVTADLSNDPVLTLDVPRTTGKWALKVALPGKGDVELQHDTTATGAHTYDLSAITGWTGTQTFQVKLFQIGDSAGTSTTLGHLAIYPAQRWLTGASSSSTSWEPAALKFSARYGQGSAQGTDVFHGTDAFTRVVTTRSVARHGAASVIAGAVSGTATYDRRSNVVTVTQDGYTYAVATSAGRLRLFDGPATLGQLADGDTVTGGSWGVVSAHDGTTAVGVGFAVGTDDEARSHAARAALGAASTHGAARDVKTWDRYWDRYLASAPAPKDFAIHGVDAAGVTSSDVRDAYYRAWVQLEENVLPATPETGNEYAQLSTGKASLWTNGTPGISSVASWDSLLGMQDLVHTDPASAWASFQGLMAKVGDDGSLAGESLPSRKAQTAWVLYEVTGDEGKLRDVYAPLVADLRWEADHLRWILGSHDYTDERDGEFVASLIYDLGYAEKISRALGHQDDAGEWSALGKTLTADYESWFFPATGPYATVQKVYLDTSRSKAPVGSDNPAGDFLDAATGRWTDPGLAMYTTTALAIPELSDADVAKVVERFRTEYDTDQQLAGLASVAIKAPDAQLMTYGLLDRGYATEANVVINSLTRDIVRSGQFAEVYQASSGKLSDTPIARGVAPSLFGIANLIDNVWLANGVRLESGTPTFVRTSAGLSGGVDGLSYHGHRYDVRLQRDSAVLSGDAVRLGVLPRAVALPTVGASVTAQRPHGHGH